MRVVANMRDVSDCVVGVAQILQQPAALCPFGHQMAQPKSLTVIAVVGRYPIPVLDPYALALGIVADIGHEDLCGRCPAMAKRHAVEKVGFVEGETLYGALRRSGGSHAIERIVCARR
jgi:hypothetical protein